MKNRLFRSAIEYAKNGWAVLPLKKRSKSPATAHGVKDATTDLNQIAKWWRQDPDYNIGIACGKKSGGLLVIDLDIDEEKGLNGYESLQEWEKEHGSFPDTVQSITGRGGYQLFYRSDKNYKNSVRIIEGIDVRSEGGYVVVPPSIHPNGNEYQWEYWLDDFNGELTKADEIVKQFLEQQKNNGEQHFVAPEQIIRSERNNTLFQIACSLQSKGLSDDAIFSAVMAENQAKCDVPLKEKEVHQIVSSALKYEKGQMIAIDHRGKVIEDVPRPKFQYTEKGKMAQTIHNCIEAINCDPNFHNKVMLNELTQSICLMGEYPWKRPTTMREWTNGDDKQMYQYLEENYGLTKKENIDIALSNISNSNSFNPVIDKLEECHKKYLEGKKDGYIKKLLPGFLGADDTEYTYEVMKLVLLGAICRVYHPGCKFDYVMILFGEQGIGKSTFIRFLGMNDEWVNDNFNSVDPKIGAENLRGVWIAEMAELLATKKAKEIEQVKSFITSVKDTYRSAYEKRAESHPRRSIFIGTTNDSHFLTDPTGNRRYLPIIVHADKVTLDLFGDKEEVNSLIELAWGEAMEIFLHEKTFPKLVLPENVIDDAKEMQLNFTEENTLVGIIENYLDTRRPDARICVLDLFQNALERSGQPTRRETNELHDIMQNMEGWEPYPNKQNKARCGKYGIQRCYVRKSVADNRESNGNNEDGFEPVGQMELPFD
nr:VapE domain-containing protein [uncultured Anaerostipes sp.]